ncbi:MAG TPA: beta-ketoacyl-ACP synthase II [Solirubrobacterales bacterium]|jgi:3-oxoacyl-[acyl-carrier-protein] synthase II|nr:beta-ketoacyl-ACP synthase II [Solirubrobacterales bacterium]
MRRRVAITGIGAVTPLGVGADALIDRWIDRRCGIEDGEGQADEFDPIEFMTRKEARRSDRFAQFAIAASDEAVSQAGWSEGLPYVPQRVGCVVGTGIGGLSSLEEQENVLRERGAKAVSPLSVPLMMGNAGAAALAMRHGIHGHTYGVVSACAAGAHAVGAGTRLIEGGDADAVVVGGAEAALTGLAAAAFMAMGATSPTGVSRPFDRRRDGFVMGEGAGVLVLEDAEVAERRGAEAVGEVLGYAATSDAHHLTAPEPSGAEAARAIELALDDAEIGPADLDYVNAHGTSTPLNDRSETESLKTALGDDARRVPVSSTKSAIGHLLGAAGAVEAIATVQALRRRTAPPTLGWEERDDGLDLDYVPGEARALGANGNGAGDPLVAISNSFGFGGHNAVLCLRA